MHGTIIITLAGQGWTFEADPGATVLEAAQRAGIRLPSSCRNGTCRTCLCRLERGAIHYRIDWPGVSVDEKREGYILPCVAVADTDLVIAAPAATRPVLPRSDA
ncbi:2Fe-2S iron-sulfur cluster binding domain-containing protein [Duganella sp. FT27W]|uniref:2Fe-2S iron-sulfur cluster-binding protein n=1 Tax=Duganella sp. FT27W TaxID=2654636 RepID=UPI00128D978A|nr:2Fe-2S iron-sulfur cluster binding domain-containing protein [Duganella sp. FT27W]MPQ58900.1 2Fe-2S iron-sulfur cluster binding domain-containing protein [Duganella sp. FT27W]